MPRPTGARARAFDSLMSPPFLTSLAASAFATLASIAASGRFSPAPASTRRLLRPSEDDGPACVCVAPPLARAGGVEAWLWRMPLGFLPMAANQQAPQMPTLRGVGGSGARDGPVFSFIGLTELQQFSAGGGEEEAKRCCGGGGCVGGHATNQNGRATSDKLWMAAAAAVHSPHPEAALEEV